MAASPIMRIPCKVAELSLDISLNCGQSFRWKKRPSGEWAGVLAGYLWLMNQDEAGLNYRVVTPVVQSEASPSESLPAKKAEMKECIDYEHMVKDYFQLDIDLESLYRQWSLADANFDKVAKNFVGVRMLKQDPVENLFAFICSSNNNIQRITGMVEKLCETYGNHLLTYEDVAYYTFPSIESLAEEKVESKLRTLGFGYRAKFIQQSAAKIMKNGGRDWLLNLRTVSYLEAKSSLMTLPGIGAKVADCICLMSLNHSVAIPVDTHVFQIAKANYVPHLSQTKSVTDKVYNEISAHFQSLFGTYAGWAHSCRFTSSESATARRQEKKCYRRDQREAGPWPCAKKEEMTIFFFFFFFFIEAHLFVLI
ncbi:N-glycosylase/DNA lyase isoform X2 [Daphnia magna]|uniref:N-glycosylase/DNA lyase isoform X2 n=1 Tax=Daphnia magna TaxID=35525 RepID=UPI001E1BA5A8|nr:N-glycosylase/DNA lyase isoform X2 [Daphnia magna]